jgi:hypothetical protein
MVWPVPAVREMALSKSFPTPKIQDPLRVLVSVTFGAPELAFDAAVAPIAPDPLDPDTSTPEKLTIVIDE